jgi:hypothetical protein
MQVEALSVELRSRPMWEAADLGVRLVQANAASVWRTVTPVMVGLLMLLMPLFWVKSWLPLLLLFWLKPWLDRSILFVLARAIFGQPTRFRDLWQAQRSVWWGSLVLTLVVKRLSPWRSFTQPIEQLEHQRGTSRRQRARLLLSGQRGYGFGLQGMFYKLEVLCGLSLLGLAIHFAPEGGAWDIWKWLLNSGPSGSAEFFQFFAYSGVVLLLEPFFVAAGFAMYINRRVELESWDIEQEFRRAFA